MSNLTDQQCDERDAAIVGAIDVVMSWRAIGSIATVFVMALNKAGWDVRPLAAPTDGAHP